MTMAAVVDMASLAEVSFPNFNDRSANDRIRSGISRIGASPADAREKTRIHENVPLVH